MNDAVAYRGGPPLDQFRHRGFGGGARFDRHKADALPPVGKALDDRLGSLLVLSGVPDFPSGPPVQVTDGLLADRQGRAAGMNLVERVAVSAHLFLVAVAQDRLPEDQSGHAGLIDLDAFDP